MHESRPPRQGQAYHPESQRGFSLWAETRNTPTRQDSGSTHTSVLRVFFLTDQETRLSVEREGREGSERGLREKMEWNLVVWKNRQELVEQDYGAGLKVHLRLAVMNMTC